MRSLPFRFSVRLLAGIAASLLAIYAARPALAYMTYSVTELGVLPNGAGSVAYAINASGQVVGWADAAGQDAAGNPVSHAFLYKGGGLIDLGVLGVSPNKGDNSYAYAINEAGRVVGASHTGFFDLFGNPIFHAFSYQGGALTDLGALGGDNSYAYGINPFGTIVGQADTTDDASPCASGF